ncbi:hypothetical protein PRUPE_2G254000 [Prunus persica]|uniref:Uncharacterized protein n=1 Tax=Prunus persica TaxID=3760 RepID=A0A251QLL0_PRUPE|nr:hypothetical protein PRUPE_2G254000 [Prunus persica]
MRAFLLTTLTQVDGSFKFEKEKKIIQRRVARIYKIRNCPQFSYFIHIMSFLVEFDIPLILSNHDMQ